MSDEQPASATEQQTVVSEAAGIAAWRSPRAWIVLVAVIAGSVAIDLVSKHLAFEHVAGDPVTLVREDVISSGDTRLGPNALIPPHAPVVVVPNLLDFTLVLNRGAVFGIGAGKRWFFVGFTAIAVGFGLYVFASWTRAGDHLTHTWLGLVLGGGLGNLYDRLVFACVRDFIHPLPGVDLPFGLSWPGGNTQAWPYVSNIADLFLIIGIVGLIVHVWRADAPAKHEQAEANDDT
ncbi:MAG: signal peptidase II [Planctomycetota bacterium]